MTTTTSGIMPGQVTPENDEGTADGHVNNPQNTTNNSADFKSILIAACAHIKGAISGFYLDRAIGLDSIALLILAAILLVQGVLQWMH